METKNLATTKIEVFDRNNYYNKEEVSEVLGWTINAIYANKNLKKIKVQRVWYYEKKYINEFAKEIELRKKIAVPGVYKNPNPVKPQKREGYTTITEHSKKLGCSYFTLLQATKVYNVPKEMYNFNTYHFKIDDLNECYKKYLIYKKNSNDKRSKNMRNYNTKIKYGQL
jgi:hypothetical protein